MIPFKTKGRSQRFIPGCPIGVRNSWACRQQEVHTDAICGHQGNTGLEQGVLLATSSISLSLLKSLSLCPTLCDPMDYSPAGSSVHGISRQEYWSGLPFSSPGDLSNPGIKPWSPALQADSLPSEPPRKPSSIWNPLSRLQEGQSLQSHPARPSATCSI